MAISSDLEHLLLTWLPRQRWMPVLGPRAGGEPDVSPQSVVRIAEVSDDDAGTVQCLLVIVAVRGTRRHSRLSVPLTLRTSEDFSLRSHLVGTVDDLLLGKSYVYDGAADPVFVMALADAIADARGGTGEELLSASEEFQSLLAGDELPYANTQSTPVPDEGRAPSELRTREEYGASLLRRAQEHRFRRAEGLGAESRVEIDGPDGTYALTLLREIGAENPPALRYPLALTAVDSSSVQPVIGWSRTRWFDDVDLTTVTAPFALLSHALPGSRRAWRSAVEKALVVDSGSVGSFNRQASVLGSVVGRLHKDLGAEFGHVRSEGDPTRRLVRKWRERVDWALSRAPGALASLEGRLRAHADALDELDSIGTLQRIHGELTLDHITVGTAEGPRIIGFGIAPDEPRPVEIDLVAMVRSIDYAAGYAWLQRSEGLTEEEARLRTLATRGLDDDLRDDYVAAPEHLWYRRTANSLLSGYSHARGETYALADPVMRAALIDRLLVEVVSELRNRPAWLIVPLSALLETLGPEDTSVDAATRADETAAGETTTGGPAAGETTAGGPAAGGSTAGGTTAGNATADGGEGRTTTDAGEGGADEVGATADAIGPTTDAFGDLSEDESDLSDDDSLRVDPAMLGADDDAIAAGADVLPDRSDIDDDHEQPTVTAAPPEESEQPKGPEESQAPEEPEQLEESEESEAPGEPEAAGASQDPEEPVAPNSLEKAPVSFDPASAHDAEAPVATEDPQAGPVIPAKPAWLPSAMRAVGGNGPRDSGPHDLGPGDSGSHDPGTYGSGDATPEDHDAGDIQDSQDLDEDGAGDDETDSDVLPRSARGSRGTSET